MAVQDDIIASLIDQILNDVELNLSLESSTDLVAFRDSTVHSCANAREKVKNGLNVYLVRYKLWNFIVLRHVTTRA